MAVALIDGATTIATTREEFESLRLLFIYPISLLLPCVCAPSFRASDAAETLLRVVAQPHALYTSAGKMRQTSLLPAAAYN